MKKKNEITEEEFEAIKEAISGVLALWRYGFIEANDGNGSSKSMNKETFFDNLKEEFIIRG